MKVLNFKLVQWFRQLQVRSKIILGVGSLVIFGLLILLAFYYALSISGDALQRVVNEEEPTSAAVYGMENNVVRSGSKVMNYLQTGDGSYRAGALKEKEEFDYFLNQYNKKANNSKEKDFALEARQLYSEYWELGEQLMDGRADRGVSFLISLEQITFTDELIDFSIAKINQARSGAATRRQFLQQLKTSLAEMGKDLGVYLRLGRLSSSSDLSNEAEQFLVQLGYYQALSLGRAEKIRAQDIADSFDVSYGAINRAINLHEQSTDTLAEFFSKRTQLDQLLSEQMLPVAKNDLDNAKFYAEQTADRTKLSSLFVAPIVLLFSMFVVYVLTVSMTQPAEELAAGAAALSKGELEYRIPDLGTDELGQLGRQFNLMAERLEQTTVSRDSLEDSEAALRISEQRYARAVSGTNDGFFDWDMQANEVYFSPRWKAMLGYTDENINNDPESYFRFVHPDDIDLLRQNITVYFDRPGEYLVNEHRVLHSNGEYGWVLLRALASDEVGNHRTTRLSGSLTDIHAQKVAEHQLVHDAMHDRLTGLPNRHLLLERLQHFLDNKKRREYETCGLLFLDLDGFKMVNDSFGHPAGDRLLVALPQRLAAILKSTDTLARFGGDEFVILVEGINDVGEAELIAERIQETLERPFNMGATAEGVGTTYVGASIGIAMSDENYHRAEDMLRDADIAMYRAKALGKKRHVIFNNTMRGHVVKRAQLENDLHHALEREEFIIYYQPIIDLQQSRKLVGFEALLRWQHPEQGLIEPDDFIPLLDESGLIIPVGEWLLKTASATVKSWHRKNYTPSVSVNVSAVQLREQGLVAAVAKALASSKLDAQYLTLEITETNVMQNEELARTLLEKVKKLGVQLSIDDFGVGYSSLSYLKHFPWDYVKIDRSFVQDVANNTEDAAIIEAIISLVHSLDFNVVAEGVENIEQLEYLRTCGIDCVQGYLLAHPALADEWKDLNSISSKRFLKQAFESNSEKGRKVS